MALTVPAPEYGPEYNDRVHAPPLAVFYEARCNCSQETGDCDVAGKLRCVRVRARCFVLRQLNAGRCLTIQEPVQVRV